MICDYSFDKVIRAIIRQDAKHFGISYEEMLAKAANELRHRPESFAEAFRDEFVEGRARIGQPEEYWT